MPNLPNRANQPLLIPGLRRTYAAWPVWSGSTTAPVRSQPLAKRQVVKLYHRLRGFERQTREPGRQDGAIGRNGLAVFHALVFDFLNYVTGRLDPPQALLAKAACISERSVARGLAKLKAAGVVDWLRRCCEDRDEAGRFRLRQRSNAYAILPSSQWRGYREPEPVPLEPWQLGAVPPLPDALEAAVAGRAGGASFRATLDALAAAGPLGRALAGLGDLLDCQAGKETGTAG